jgi:hypothetical protein
LGKKGRTAHLASFKHFKSWLKNYEPHIIVKAVSKDRLGIYLNATNSELSGQLTSLLEIQNPKQIQENV